MPIGNEPLQETALAPDDFWASLEAGQSFSENLPATSPKPAHPGRGSVRGLDPDAFWRDVEGMYGSPGGYGGVQGGLEEAARNLVVGAAQSTAPAIAAGIGALGGNGADFYQRVQSGARAVSPPSISSGSLLTEDLPQAAGALPTMIAGGAVGGPLGVGLMGASQAAPQMYYDVLEKTGDRGKAALAGLIGTGLGASEAAGGAILGNVPVLSKLLGGLEKATGGSVAKRLLAGGLGAGVQEGGQEAIQSVLQAKTYEALTGEDIDEWKQAAKGAEVGGIIGTIFQMLTGVPLDRASRPMAPQQVPGAPRIAQETTSPETPPQPTVPTEGPAADQGGTTEGPDAASQTTVTEEEAYVQAETKRDEERRGRIREAGEKGYASYGDVLESLLLNEDVPAGVLARYPGILEKAVELDEGAKARAEEVPTEEPSLEEVESGQRLLEATVAERAAAEAITTETKAEEARVLFGWRQRNESEGVTAKPRDVGEIFSMIGNQAEELLSGPALLEPGERRRVQSAWAIVSRALGPHAAPDVYESGQFSREQIRDAMETISSVYERHTPREVGAEDVVLELEKKQKQEQLFSGVPLTGEDIKADIGKALGRFKLSKEQAESEPDILGNRRTLGLVRKAVDYLSPHRRAKEARLGKRTDLAEDYVLEEENRRGKTRSRTERAGRETDAPILRAIRAGKITQQGTGDADPGWSRYFLARHAEEGNALVASRQPEVVKAERDFAEDRISAAEYNAIVGEYASGEKLGIGMSNAEAEAILKAVESGPKAKIYRELGRRFDALNAETRALWLEYGLHPEEAISGMEKAYKHYAPTRSDIEEDAPLPVGSGVAIRGRETRMRTGRTTMPDDPLAYAIAQRNQAIIRGERNRVAESWAKNIETNSAFWAGIAKVTKGKTTKAVVDGVVREMPDPSYARKKNVLAFKRKGEPVYIEVDPKYSELARALNNADVPKLEALESVVRSASALTRTFAKLRTVYSPEFLLTNLTRDLGTGVFTSAEQGRKFARTWAKGIPSAWKELSAWKLSKEGEFPNASVQEYVESGAPISYLDFKTVKETADAIERDLRSNEPGAAAKVSRGYRAVLGLMEGAADVIENATRYSAFKAARKQGMSVDQAAHIAKNLTVNFERKGEWGSLANAFYAFSTAGMAGTARTVKLLKNPRAGKMILGAVAANALWDQIARNMMGDDEDGEPRWDKLSTGLKSRYFLIPKYWTDSPDDLLRIPMPPGISWLFFGGQEIGAALSGDRDPAETAMNIASAALDVFNPLGGGSEKGMHKAVKVAAPTIADPFVDLLANKDFAGRPIAPDRTGPNAYKAWPDVSETARIVAEKVGSMTGGDKYEPGAIDVSPEHIEFMADYVFGGLGQFFRKTYMSGKAAADSVPVDERDVPILSRFQTRISPWASDRNFKKAMTHLRAEEKRQTGGKPKTKGRAPLIQEGLRIENEIEKLRKKLDALVSKKDREGAKSIEEQMDSLRQRFLARYRKKYED